MTEYEKILNQFLEKDDRLMVLTAENRAPLRNLVEKIGDRFLDTGITEQAMIGIAAGLALRGRKPVVHALAAFLTMRAFEFIRTDVGIGGLPVKLVGWVPGILSDANGPTHQAIEDVSIMRGIPGMHVFCPSDFQDLILGLPSVLESESPTYIRYNTLQSQYTHQGAFELGKAEVLSAGNDICILSYGALFGQAYQAVQLLHQEGLSVGLVNMRMLSPVDEKAILNAAKSKLLVTIEDHFVRGGLATIVAEVLVKYRQTACTLNIGFDGQWFKPALLQDVLAYEKLGAQDLAGRVLRTFREI